MTRLKQKIKTQDQDQMLDVQTKIDKIISLREKGMQISAEYQSKLKPLQSDIARMEKEVEEYLTTQQLKELVSTSGHARAELVTKHRTSREVDTQAFYNMLKKGNKLELFWQYASVGVTAACKDFGEKILTAAKALHVTPKETVTLDIHEG